MYKNKTKTKSRERREAAQGEIDVSFLREIRVSPRLLIDIDLKKSLSGASLCAEQARPL